MTFSDVIIIGAGAAGLMCAIEAGKRGRKVTILDHARKAGNKIRMSGGGRCNFTNYNIHEEHYLSHNPHFVKSALSRFTQWDFIALVQAHNIPYVERDHGQLFCKETSKDILDMLLSECHDVGVNIHLKSNIKSVTRTSEELFELKTENRNWKCKSLVIATGGLSIPTMGASPFGYHIAEQFGLKVWSPSAGLVPVTFQPEDKTHFEQLSGVSTNAIVSCNNRSFQENILITHRGLSGPAILQISNYWEPGNIISIDLLPEMSLDQLIANEIQQKPNILLKTLLNQILPQRLALQLLEPQLSNTPIKSITKKQIRQANISLKEWKILPSGTEGYRTAEITRGGINCDDISSKTFEAKSIPNLYFIGEVLDVTGWLGGYNFQWAWSSGWCAGQYI